MPASLLFRLPWIVAAKVPKMPFRITAAVASSAAIHFRIFVDDHRAGCSGVIMPSLAVPDDHVQAHGDMRTSAVALRC